MAGAQDTGAPGPSKPLDYDTVFTNAKAGMDGVDAEHVKRVVYEASKGSAHHENEQRKQAALDERIARMKAAAGALSAAQLAGHAAAMEEFLAELEAGRDLSRTWLHVDMDAFYAAVEERDRPELVGKPFAVGGEAMISTASYAARRFGVRSAMPGFIAKRLCPQLIFVKHDFAKYVAASEATRAVFRDFDPDFQAGSLDEAYLDVTDYCAQHGVGGEEVAALIRQRVQADTRLTCSVGIAPNRMLAKICSDRNKPNGQFRLEASREAVMAFMRDLPLRKVPGVGKMTQRMLAAFGMDMGGDLLAPQHQGVLWGVFTPTSREWLARVALGLGGTQHTQGPAPGEVGRKGMSCERTFRPLDRRAELDGKLREVAEHLAEDMAREGLKAKSVMLKVKLTNFEVKTRNLALTHYVSTADELYAVGQRLLAAALPASVRLLGLRVSNFFEPGRRQPGQLSLEEAMTRRGHMQQQQQQPEGQAEQTHSGASSGGDGGHMQHQQHQQRQEGWDLMASDEGEDGWGACGGSDGEEALGSGALGSGDPVEPTLRDWQPADPPAEGQGRQQQQQQQQHNSGAAQPLLAPWPDRGQASPPSLPAMGPAAAVHDEREAAVAAAPAALVAAGGSGSRPVHMPQTIMDVLVQQAADSAAQHAGNGGPQPQERHHHQHQQGPARAPGPLPAPPPTWACPACTFENARANFWCQMCSTPRHGRALPPSAGGVGVAGGGSSAKPASSASSRAGASSSKVGGKRGRKSLAAAAGGAPSILRFMSRQASPTNQQQQPAHPQAQHHPNQEQQQQQQQQQQPPLPLPSVQQPQQQHNAGPEQQAGNARHFPHAGGAAAGAAGVAGQADGAEAGASTAGPADQAGPSTAAGEEEEDLYSDWGGDEGEYSDEGELLPGEDWLECQYCRCWVRGSRIQAHEDKHVAEKLQRKEEELGEIFAGKRPVGSSARLAGKQATLTAMAKRLKR